MATVKPTKVQKEFIAAYWAAETRAMPSSGGATFLQEDRMALAKQFNELLERGVFKNLWHAAGLIHESAADGSDRFRHNYRIRKWINELEASETTAKVPVKVTKAEAVKPVASAPVTTPTLQHGDELKFMTNSIDQVKSLCMVAMRRGLSREKIMSILTGGMNEAVDNFENEKLRNELTTFLAARNITAAIAVEALQKM